MVPPGDRSVDEAIEALSAAIEGQVAMVNATGAKAFEQRNYEQASQALKRAGQLAEFQERVAALRLDWEETFGPPPEAPAAEKGAITGPTDPIATLRLACVQRIEKRLRSKLTRAVSDTCYASADGKLAVTCAVSKEYLIAGNPGYWFAFHPYQAEFLQPAAEAYVSLGCGTADRLLLIPYLVFCQWLDSLGTTKRDDRVYWHLHVSENSGAVLLKRREGASPIDVTQYLMP